MGCGNILGRIAFRAVAPLMRSVSVALGDLARRRKPSDDGKGCIGLAHRNGTLALCPSLVHSGAGDSLSAFPQPWCRCQRLFGPPLAAAAPMSPQGTGLTGSRRPSALACPQTAGGQPVGSGDCKRLDLFSSQLFEIGTSPSSAKCVSSWQRFNPSSITLKVAEPAGTSSWLEGVEPICEFTGSS